MASADTMETYIKRTGNKAGSKKPQIFMSPSASSAPTATMARLYPGNTQEPAPYNQPDFEQDQKDAFNRALAAIQGQTPGGGGISNKQKNLNRYSQMIANMLRGNKFNQDFDNLRQGYENTYGLAKKEIGDLLNSSLTSGNELSNALRQQYGANQEDLLSRLRIAGGQAEGQIGSAMDQLKSYLTQNQVNPYANFQVAGAPTGEAAITPQMRDLLATQGVSAQPLEQFAQATGQQNQAQADAFGNIARIMAATTAQANAGRLADVEAQRAGALSGLAGNRAAAEYGVRQQTQDLLNQLASEDLQRKQGLNRFGLEQRLALENQLADRSANLAASQASTRQNYISMLLDAIAKGGNPGKLKGLI